MYKNIAISKMKPETVRKGGASGSSQGCIYQAAAPSATPSTDHLYRRGRHISLRTTIALLMTVILIISIPVHSENLDNLSPSSTTIDKSFHLYQSPVNTTNQTDVLKINNKDSTVTLNQIRIKNTNEREKTNNSDKINLEFSDSEDGEFSLSGSEYNKNAEENEDSIGESEGLILSTSGGSIQDDNDNNSNKKSAQYNETKESNWYNWYQDHITQNSIEISQDFNFSLISEIINNLGNKRESRVYMPHMVPSSRDGEVPVNVQPVSLWDYFSSFIFNEESQPTSQEIQNSQQQRIAVNKKRVSNPCDQIQGNIEYWKLNARPLSVIVVGGGIAGLASLKTLIRLGFNNAILLEAQHRLGGGVNTVRHERWVLEEGPSKIRGGGKNPMYLIAKELEEVMDHPPSHRWEKVAVDNDGNVLTEGAVVKGFKVIEDIQKEVKSGGLLNYLGQAVGKFYVNRFKALWGTVVDQSFMHAWIYYLHQMICARDGLSGWFKASARDASTFEHMEPDYYWKTGADKAVHYLLRGVPPESVHLSSPVCRIFWDINEQNEVLTVTADGSSFRSGALILTIPPSVLKESHRMLFIPNLPKESTDAFENIESGTSNKIFLGWNSPWWGSDKPLDLHVFWKDFNFPKEMDWVMSIVRVSSTPQRPNMVEMIVTGDASLSMEEMVPEEIIGHLIYFLKRVSKREDIPLPAFFHRSKWNSNPWTRGSYGSHVTINGEMKRGIRNRRSLAPKITNSRGRQSLFFAGEHTSNDRYGTMDGAMMSGVRAAHWVVQEDKQRRELAQLHKVKPSHKQKITSQNNPNLYKEIANYYDFFKDPESFLEEMYRSGVTQGQMLKDVEISSIESRNEPKNIRKLLRQRQKQEKIKQHNQDSNKPSLQITGPVISRNPPPVVFVDTSSSEDQVSSSLDKSEELKKNRKKQGKRRKKKKNKNKYISSDAETNVQLTLPISKLIPGLFAEQTKNSQETEDSESTTSAPTTTTSTTLRTQPITTTTPVPQHPPKPLTKPRPMNPSVTHATSIPNHGNYPQHSPRPVTHKPIQSPGSHVTPISNHGNYPQHPPRPITPKPIQYPGAPVAPISNPGNYPQHPPRPITPKPIQHSAPLSDPSRLQYASYANPPKNHHPPLQPNHPSHNQYSTNTNTQPHVKNNAASFLTQQEGQISGQPHAQSPHNIETQVQFRPVHQSQHFASNVNNNQKVMNANYPSDINPQNQNKQSFHHQYDIHSSPKPSNAHPVVQSQNKPQSSQVNFYPQHNSQPLHNYQLNHASKSHPNIQINQGQELVHPHKKQIQHISENHGNLNLSRIKNQGVQTFPNQQPISQSSSTHYSPGFKRPNTPIKSNGFVNRPNQQNSSPHLIDTGNMPPNVPQKPSQMSLITENSDENEKCSQSKYSNEQSSNRNRRKNNKKRNHNKKQQSFTSVESSTRTKSNKRKNRNKKDKNNKRTNNGEFNQEIIRNEQLGTTNSQEYENNNNNKNKKRTNHRDINQETIKNVQLGSTNSHEYEQNNNRGNNRKRNRKDNENRKFKKQNKESNKFDRNQQSNKHKSSSKQKSTVNSKETLSKDVMQSTLKDKSPTPLTTSSVKHVMLPQIFHITGPVYTNHGAPVHLQLFKNSTIDTSTGSLDPLIQVKDNITKNANPSNSTSVPLTNIDKSQNPIHSLTEVEQKFVSTLTTRTRPFNLNLNDKELLHLLSIDRNSKREDVNQTSGESKLAQLHNYYELNKQNEYPLKLNESYRPNNKILGGSRIHNMRPQYQIPDSFVNSQEKNTPKAPEQPADSPT